MVKLVQDYFSISAKDNPDKLAVDVGEEVSSEKEKEVFNKSFGWLENYSNQLARCLKEENGIQKGDRVAFMFKKLNLAYSIASILAILKCDAVYVPIHYKLPPERIAKILSDSGAKFLVCLSILGKELKKHTALPKFSLFEIDKKRGNVEKKPKAPLIYRNTNDEVAYIMYTSGSTGNPKGVMITHGNIINATEWAVEEFGITNEARMSQHPPLNFDLSTFDLYCAFKVGATLYPVPENTSIFPGELIRFIETNRLTLWNSVPSVMVQMALTGLIKPERMPTLKKIFFNGEGFPTKYLTEWMGAYPNKEFVNMYGPTETTVQCSFYKIPKPSTDLTKLVPIGKACRNVEIFAVKENGGLAGANEIGELYVAGKGVGKGYWNDSEKTANSFIPHPFKKDGGFVYKTGDLVRLREDGNYEFIGRKDFQVKVMGNRIELGDIEAALYSLSYVKEAGVIVATAEETSGNEIIAFVVPEGAVREEDIRTDLGKSLPAYMIPHRIELKDLLPHTTTGKIDRPKLKEEWKKLK